MNTAAHRQKTNKMADPETPYPSLRIFKRDWMEWFTHVHPLTPLILWTPIISWLFWESFATLSPYTVGALGVLGFVFWTLIEYLLHRFLFHFTAEGGLQERLQFIMHGLHHADPVDPTRLVMPPLLSLLLASGLFGVFRLILGATYVYPFFASFLIGYLCYDYIHYAVHHFQPRTRIGKLIKQNHMMHHFVTPNARWGVSSPLWDYVLGTTEEKGKQQAV